MQRPQTSVITKIILPVIALAGIALAIFMAWRDSMDVTPAEPVAQPASVPYQAFLAGSGVIESASTEIEVGGHLPGIAKKIFVEIGDHVKKGAPLVVLDTRHLEAKKDFELTELEIAYAEVRQAKANLSDRQAAFALAKKIEDKRAISVDQLDRLRYAVQVAEAGVDVANAKVKKAQSSIKATEIDIARMTVLAPITGEILQVNVEPGEYVAVPAENEPMIVIGDSSELRVRVDIDEHDAWRFTPGAPAMGVLRGNPSISLDLSFIKFEPLVIPRQQLSGDTSQKVDERVLQVIYRFDKEGLPVYIGQQVDVWIEVPSES